MDLYLILLLSFTTLFLKSFSSSNPKYDNCSKLFQCGNIQNIGYPFYDESTRPDYCGYPGFKLNCNRDYPQITISWNDYYVKSIDLNNYIIDIYRQDKWASSCPDSLTNTTIDFSKFKFSSADQNMTFYNCKESNFLSSQMLQTTCTNLGEYELPGGYYFTPDMLDGQADDVFQICKSNIFLPILQSAANIINRSRNLVDLIGALKGGFELGWIADMDKCYRCKKSNGECGYDSNKFVCHCSDQDYDISCVSDKGHKSLYVAIGHLHHMVPIGASIAAVIGIVMLGFYIYFSKNILQKWKPNPTNQSVEACLKNYSSHVPRRYTYTNIKKITKSFKEKLGEGGYGTVFKGSLQDGRVVAVKVCKKSKGDGQEFLNEVMSISGTNHVNIVPLLGFCFDGHKRALIYEFMPNGSLEKFIHGKDIHDINISLSAQKLFEIAIGIARGLEYLHRGCNTRIVHFDIKPHNILLDAEFTPKISDFGLAKSLKKKESIISMSGARGTAGYIAPEVFLRSFGGVSHKSDVYSYGMMVLEMVGCKKRGNHIVENSSEIYFPQWIYKQLEQEASTDDSDIILNEEEKKLERIMILVGLWCIQTNPLSRPPMSRVVDMLERKVELLEVPPMPTLASLPRQQQLIDDDSTTLIISSTSSSIIDHLHSMQNV